jgi:hypothetical protein
VVADLTTPNRRSRTVKSKPAGVESNPLNDLIEHLARSKDQRVAQWARKLRTGDGVTAEVEATR